jgi:hypothetical protein
VVGERTAAARRRLTGALWAALALYAGWWISHVRTELTAPFDVVGPDRTFRHPLPSADGFVVDPRPRSLDAELEDRYGRRIDWRAVSPTGTGLGRGMHPRLLFVEGEPTPWLLVGSVGIEPLVFDPRRGLVRLGPGRLPDDVPAADLVGVREAPW